MGHLGQGYESGRSPSLHNKTSTNATISKFEYEYNPVGNRTKMTVDDSDDTSYEYDDVYQLTKVTYPDSSTHDFAYDANGNRTDWDDSAGPDYDYYYDTADQLTSSTDGASTWTHYYDGNGAMTARAESPRSPSFFGLRANRGTSHVTELAFNAEATRTRRLGPGCGCGLATLGPGYGSGASPLSRL